MTALDLLHKCSTNNRKQDFLYYIAYAHYRLEDLEEAIHHVNMLCEVKESDDGGGGDGCFLQGHYMWPLKRKHPASDPSVVSNFAFPVDIDL